MTFKLKPLFKRSCVIAFEAAMILALLLIIAGSLFLWRLSTNPLEIEFARPVIENALKDTERGLYVTMDKIMLHWPALRGPLLLGIQGATLHGAEGQSILSIDHAAIGLKKRMLLLGRIQPEILILNKPALQIQRLDEHVFVLDFQDEQTSTQIEQAPKSKPVLEMLLAALSDENGREASSPLSALKRLEIKEARLLIDDKVLGLSWVLPRTDFTFTKIAAGLQADIKIELPAYQGQRPSIKSRVILSSKSKNLSIEATLQNFPPALLAEKFPELKVLEQQDALIQAQLRAQLDSEMNILTADMTIMSGAGTVNIPALSPDPVPFSSVLATMNYDKARGELNITKIQIALQDITIEGGADLKISPMMDEITGPLRLSIPSLPHGAIAPLWPIALKGDSSEKWIVERLSNGIFSSVFAQGNLELKKKPEDQSGWDADIKNLQAGFEFEDLNINYRAPLEPVTAAKGSGKFDLDSQTLRVKITEANLKDLKINSGEIEFIDIIKKGAGTADINVKLTGPLRTALLYVAEEPIAVKPDFDVQKVNGNLDVALNIQFPTIEDIPKEAVEIDLRGRVSDLNIPDVVKGLALSGDVFDLLVEDGKFKLKGKGKLDEHPATLAYEEFLSTKNSPHTSQVKVSLVANEALRQKFGIDLSSFMAGPAYVDVLYTSYKGGKSIAKINANLTRSTLYIDPFDYKKKAGGKATADLKALFKKGVLKEIQNLTALAPGLKIEKSQLYFRGSGKNTELSAGKISRFTIGETVANAEFEVDKQSVVKLSLNGPLLDLRPFLDHDGEKKKYDGPAMLVSVAVDRMRTAENESVQYGKIYADINRSGKFNQLEVDAIAGSGDIYLRYKPDETGKRTFRLEADDAGATLKAFGLYNTMQGGILRVYGEAVRNIYDRNLIGHAEITDFKITQAPALAQLLSVMSLPGLMQNLNGEGLVFSKMESDFDWLYRPQGSVLVLKKGSTSGNSLGLTFDGTFDNQAQTLDVSGTIIPLSGLNDVISSIPLLGDILTGGTGAFIAATYTMKGEGNNPEVSVNPLSVLTPGILRRILFEEKKSGPSYSAQKIKPQKRTTNE